MPTIDNGDPAALVNVDHTYNTGPLPSGLKAAGVGPAEPPTTRSRDMTRPARTARAVTVPCARLTGLHLVTEASGHPSLILGMSLLASGAGLGVASPTGRLVRHYTWPEVTSFAADATARDADGVSHQVLELTAAGRHHEFLVPAPGLAAFLADLSRIDAQALRQAPGLLRRRRDTYARTLISKRSRVVWKPAKPCLTNQKKMKRSKF